ncbi:amino acid synthesis family protein, partial [Acinetobacter baumannii]
MELIRKTVLHVETTYVDGGKEAAKPLKMVAAAAVIKNPWAGQGLSL